MKTHLKHPIVSRCLLAALVLAGAAGLNNSASAQVPVTIPNYSFEIATLGNGSSTTNWNGKGNGGLGIAAVTNGWFTANPDGTLPATGDGTNFAYININGNPGWVWQDLGPLQPNTTYTLTVAIGESLLGTTGQGRIALINGSNQFQATLAQTLIDNTLFTPGTFVDTNLVFSTGYQVNGDLTILLEADTGGQLIFDNVRLTTTAMPAAATALPPSLSTPSGTVYSGTVVTLSEVPGGTAPFYYQWQSDNGSGGATFANVSGATNPTLAVDTSTFPLNTPIEYQVIVTNTLGTSTSATVALTAIAGQPAIVVDTLPATGSSATVGDSVTFKASFDGSLPITYQWQVDPGTGAVPIANATNSTLTLTNLQLTDTGSYSVVAANSLGTVASTPASFTVNPVPADVGGIVASPANQVGLGVPTQFTPTWVLPSTNLLAGASPASSTGNFQLEGAGGIPVLTDGQFGALAPEGNASSSVATCGTVGAGAGSAIAYALPASATGWDLTNITVYGGWSDNGRNQQVYQVFYSTTANPTNYANQITAVGYVPALPTGTASLQSATKVVITSTNGVLAHNVAGLQFFFNILANGPENGYEGYAEFEAFGVHSAPAPVLAQNIQPSTGADVVGSSVTITASFTSLTAMTFQWFKDGVAIPNATNTALTLSNLQLTDTSVTPGYVLKASNASGTTSSSACAFTVNPLPAVDAAGLIVSPAQQTGSGSFTPTWALGSGSLIAGMLPTAQTSAGTGFIYEGGGGLPILTDGKFGSVGNSVNGSLATAGTTGGSTVTYLLPGGGTAGYDLTNIVTFGGWSDAGRDVEAYTVSYSTITAPTTFVTLDSANYVPAVLNVPTATRVTIASPTGAPFATNVAAVRFNFTTPSAKNGYQGYAELQIFGTPSTPLPQAPILVQDTLPASGSDVVGSSVTFTASFDGAPPVTYQWQVGGVPIPGATNATYTIPNLHSTDSGGYNVVASNIYGSTPSSQSTFIVNAVPAPVNGIISAPANQTGRSGVGFTPTWTAASGSLIAGLLPSSVGSGSFTLELCGGTPILTDGKVGSFADGNSTLATGGTSGGTSVTYTLPGSSTGYDFYEAVVYAGWNDNGRDQQGYTMAYSTVSAPTTFINLASPSYNPPIPGSTPSADRVTLYSSTGAPMAQHVARVKFTFGPSENNYTGYSEIQVFGLPTVPFAIAPVTVSGGNLIVSGAGGIPGGTYSWLTSTNAAAPLSTWTTNSTGVFNSTGGFSGSFPIVPGQPADFFRLKTP